jgi:hypothetical protein
MFIQNYIIFNVIPSNPSWHEQNISVLSIITQVPPFLQMLKFAGQFLIGIVVVVVMVVVVVVD